MEAAAGSLAFMKRVGDGVLLVVICVAVVLGVSEYRRLYPPAPTPPGADEIQRLVSRRDALQSRFRAAIAGSGEKALQSAPRGGLMIGLPTSLTRSIVERVVTGLFRDMTLTLRNLHVHQEGGVKAKMLLRKRQIGAFVLDVDIHEVEGVLRPGTPDVRFGRGGGFALALPVSLAEGHGRARLRLQWDSKGLAANAVCGDVDVTKEITGNVVPTDYRLTGTFRVAADGDSVILTPDFADLAVRIFVDPTEQAWRAVDEVVAERGAGCRFALEKVDLKKQLAKVVGRGFNVKVPGKLQRAIRLPAGVRQSLEVQGLQLTLDVKPTGVLLSPERLWYGADLSIRGRPRSSPR
jgi:hypothetical protein